MAYQPVGGAGVHGHPAVARGSANDIAAEHLPALLRAACDAVAIFDNRGRLLFAHDPAQQLFDEPANLLGRRLGHDLSLPLPQPALTQLGEAMGNGHAARFEHTHADRRYEVRTERDRGRLLVFWHDITNAQRLEHDLANAKACFSQVLEGMSMAVYITDTEGRIIDYNARALELWGREPDDEARYCGALHLYTADGEPLPHDQCPVAQVLQTQQATGSVEVIAEHPDGRRMVGLAQPSPLFEARGRLVGAVNCVVDITERHRAQQQLRESEEQRRLALDAANMGTWDYHVDTGIVHCDGRTAELFGFQGRHHFPLEEPLNRIHDDDRERVAREINATLARGPGTRYDIEYRVKAPGQPVRWLRAVGEVLRTFDHHDRPSSRFVGVVFDTTRAHHDRQALEEANQRAAQHLAQLEAIVGQMTEGLLVLDADGKVLSMNRAALAAHEFNSLEQAQNLTEFEQLFQTTDPATGRRIAPHDWAPARVLRGETFAEMELHVRNRRTGREWIASCGGVPIRDKDGGVQLAVVTFRDVTQRRQAEQNLRDSEAKLRFTLEAAHVGTWEWDLQTDQVTWSDNVEAIHHLPAGSFDGTFASYLSRVHPDDRARVQRAIERALDDGEPYSVEYREQLPDGSTIWIEGAGRVMRDDIGRPLRMTGVCMNITERKHAEQALRQSESQERARAAELEVLVDSVPAVVFVAHDPQGKRITGSRKAHECLRLPPGANLSRTADADERPTHFRVFQNGAEALPDQLPVQRAARGEPVYAEELEIRFDNGDVRYLFGNAIPLHDEYGQPRGALAAMIDITARKQAEQQLQQLNETLELRVAERTAELEHRVDQLRLMASELTHAEQRERRRLGQLLHDDLQQILVAAKMRLGFVDVAKTSTERRAAVTATRNLLDRSIDTARSLSVELAPRVLYDLGLGPALEWLGRWAAEQYDLKVDVKLDNAARVQGDQVPVLIFEATRELLLNVVKHARTDQASVQMRSDDGWIRVTVEDAGSGFSAHDARGRRDGTGYGLFSLEERLTILGGKVDIQSQPGRGTRVEIAVPMQRPAAAPQSHLEAPQHCASDNDSPQPPEPAVDRPLRILLTDDHEILRRGLADLIEHQPDMQVVGEAGSGEEAIEHAQRLRPDVVLMDITLPGISGIEATRRLTRTVPEACVIGLSIHEERDVADALHAAGAAAYFTKGQPADQMLRAIRNIASRARRSAPTT